MLGKCLCAVLLPFLLFGAEEVKKAELPRDIQRLVDLAAAAPPELWADVLIKIAESPKVPAANKRELLEQAFVVASRAKHGYQVKMASPRTLFTDSDAGIHMRSLDAGLSRFGLQWRAVQAMMPIDRLAARRMWGEIPRPKAIATSCTSPLVYSPAAYYAALPIVLRTGFTQDERSKGKHIDFLQPVIGSIESPLALEPVAALLDAQTIGTDAFQELLNIYIGRMQNVNADDQAFLAATQPALENQVVLLAKRAIELGMSPAGLLDAYRSYLIRHLTGLRCGDSIGNGKAGGLAQMPVKLAENYNTKWRMLAGTQENPLAEIPIKDLQPRSVGEKAELFDFWDSPASAKLMSDYKVLRFGTPEQQAELKKRPARKDGMANFLTEEERRQPAWEAALREFLRTLESWKKENGETEAHYFHQLSLMYAALLTIVPEGQMRDLVVRSQVGFLAQSTMLVEEPAEWYLQLKQIMEHHTLPPSELVGVRNEIKTGGNAVMALYADLADLH